MKFSKSRSYVYFSIVAAGAVVTRDVPPDSLVAGNPAEVKKQLNTEPPLGFHDTI